MFHTKNKTEIIPQQKNNESEISTCSLSDFNRKFLQRNSRRNWNRYSVTKTKQYTIEQLMGHCRYQEKNKYNSQN